jgi:hypothetical protein
MADAKKNRSGRDFLIDERRTCKLENRFKEEGIFLRILFERNMFLKKSLTGTYAWQAKYTNHYPKNTASVSGVKRGKKRIRKSRTSETVLS